MNLTINEENQWQDVVDRILPLEHKILLLKGNLGAGKTTFTKFLLKNLGSNDHVDSPTYSIVNEYHTPAGIIYHFDLYRLKNIGEVYDLGIDEYLDSAALCIIEWPEIYESELNDIPHHTLTIENTGEYRIIEFN